MANDIPTTPAGRQFAAWFSAFNSADYSEIDKLHIPFEKVPFQTDGILMFRHQTGGFDLIKIEETNDTKLVGLLKEQESDRLARFVMEVEESPPPSRRRFQPPGHSAPSRACNNAYASI